MDTLLGITRRFVLGRVWFIGDLVVVVYSVIVVGFGHSTDYRTVGWGLGTVQGGF